MSLAELRPDLATLRVDALAGTTAHWQVLYAGRRQPLLVPLDPQQAHRAVDFFIRNRLLRQWGHLLLLLDHALPGRSLLPVVRLERFPFSQLFGKADPRHAAMFCGCPGPLQKLTLHLPDGAGGLGKVAKLALHDGANAAIRKESQWLSMLGQRPAMAPFLPPLLRKGTLPCGRDFFSMRALPEGRASRGFDQRHRLFLQVLASEKMAVGSWQASASQQRLQARIQTVLSMVDEPLGSLLLATMAEVEQAIGHLVLPTCMMHGDFAPWNLHEVDGELCVFDWEYAEQNGNPLQDMLHFHLMPGALGRLPLQPRRMRALLKAVPHYIDMQFSQHVWPCTSRNAWGALVLHYLLDTVTFYIATSGYHEEQHPVLRSYIGLLERRKEWLPQSATRVSVTVSRLATAEAGHE